MQRLLVASLVLFGFAGCATPLSCRERGFVAGALVESATHGVHLATGAGPNGEAGKVLLCFVVFRLDGRAARMREGKA